MKALRDFELNGLICDEGSCGWEALFATLLYLCFCDTGTWLLTALYDFEFWNRVDVCVQKLLLWLVKLESWNLR